MKKRISLALALTLSISSLAFVSCKKESTTTDYDKVYPDRNVYTYSYDIIGGESVMPVAYITDRIRLTARQTEM